MEDRTCLKGMPIDLGGETLMGTFPLVIVRVLDREKKNPKGKRTSY